MKKEFSTKDREELLKTLKARFEKNTNRHKNLDGRQYKQSWKGRLKSCGR
jgi:hypothetical protein